MHFVPRKETNDPSCHERVCSVSVVHTILKGLTTSYKVPCGLVKAKAFVLSCLEKSYSASGDQYKEQIIVYVSDGQDSSLDRTLDSPRDMDNRSLQRACAFRFGAVFALYSFVSVQ